MTQRLVKPASSAARATAASSAAVVGRMAGPVEARDLQAEARAASDPPAGGRAACGRGEEARAGRASTGPARWTPAKPSAASALAGRQASASRSWPRDDLRRDRARALAVAPAHDGGGRVEHDGVGRHARGARRRARHASRRAALEAGRVDDRRQAGAAGASLDDEVEHVEGVACSRAGRARRCRRRRAGGPTRRPGRGGTSRPPSATCPPPSRRRGRRGTGPAGAAAARRASPRTPGVQRAAAGPGAAGPRAARAAVTAAAAAGAAEAPELALQVQRRGERDVVAPRPRDELHADRQPLGRRAAAHGRRRPARQVRRGRVARRLDLAGHVHGPVPARRAREDRAEDEVVAGRRR